MSFLRNITGYGGVFSDEFLNLLNFMKLYTNEQSNL